MPLELTAALLEALYGYRAAPHIDAATAFPRCLECNTVAKYLWFLTPQRLYAAGFI